MYEEDLAAIQADAFEETAVQAAQRLIEQLKANGVFEGRIVDLGCGAGAVLQAASENGYECAGIDVSQALLNLAARRVPQAILTKQSVWDAQLPEAVGITAASEVLNYLSSPRQRSLPYAKLFTRIFQALRPGGFFLFDVIIADGAESLSRRYWRESQSWAVLSEVTEERTKQRLTRRVISFRTTQTSSEDAAAFQRREEIHHVYMPRSRDLLTLLRRAGFRVQTGRGYQQEAPLPPRRQAYFCRKP